MNEIVPLVEKFENSSLAGVSLQSEFVCLCVLFSLRISQVVLYRVFNVIYRNPLVFKLSKMQKIEANALQVMHQFTDDVIRKRRSELLTGGDESVDNDGDDATTGNDIGIRKKRALLDILLHSTIDDKPLTDLDIREEVDNFMFAVSKHIHFHRFFLSLIKG